MGKVEFPVEFPKRVDSRNISGRVPFEETAPKQTGIGRAIESADTVMASAGLSVHPSLLEMAHVVKEERYERYDADVQTVVVRVTIEFPTLEQVHERFAPHFEELRNSGDGSADLKELSFLTAVREELEAFGTSRQATIDTPFIEL